MKKVKINIPALVCAVITGVVLVTVGITQSEKNVTNDVKKSLTREVINPSINNNTPLNSDNSLTVQTDLITTIQTAEIIPETVVTEPPITEINQTTIQQTTIMPNETTITSQMFNNESELVSYVQDIPSNVENYINKENVERAKDYAIDKFIQIVDFICYDQEIGGIKFSELTDSAKKDVIKVYETLDGMINNKFPNYKETIKDKTGNAYEYIKNIVIDKKQKLENYIISTIGSDKYAQLQEGIKEVNQDTKDTINDIKEEGSKAWQKIKDKYENFRENNK